MPAQAFLVPREHEVRHEMHGVAGGEVLAGVFVERLVELAYEFLEDGAHGGVVHHLGVQFHLAKAFHDLEEEARLVELGYGVVEIEFLDDLAHVGAEPGGVGPQIGGEVGGVGEELGKIEATAL